MTGAISGSTRAAATQPLPATRFPAFDGLRAIAALSVVGVHWGAASGFTFRNARLGDYVARLDVGVAVFFVISGFLLYRPFVASRFTGSAPPDLRSYFRNRVLRILPAFWVAYTVIVFLLPRPEQPEPGLTGILTRYTLTHIYFEAHVLEAPLTQAWSLATEISFYLFLPVYALALRRLGSTPASALRWELGGLGALYAASVVFRAAVLASPLEHPGWPMTWLPARTDQFALGMVLAVGSAWWTTHGREPRWLAHRVLPFVSWALAAVAFWTVATQVELSKNPAPFEFTGTAQLQQQFLYGAVGFFLVAPAAIGLVGRGPVRAFLATAPMQRLGDWSYATYLWHVAMLDIFLVWTDPPRSAFGVPDADEPAMLAFVVVTTLVVAAASWYLLERPILRLKRRPAPPAVAAAPAAAAPAR